MDLVSLIREGMRAYTIEVTEQPDVAWFVLPGYRVDVVLQVKPSGAPGPVQVNVIQSTIRQKS